MDGGWKTLFPVFLGVLMAFMVIVLWKAVKKREGFEDGAASEPPHDPIKEAEKPTEWAGRIQAAVAARRKRLSDAATLSSQEAASAAVAEGFHSRGPVAVSGGGDRREAFQDVAKTALIVSYVEPIPVDRKIQLLQATRYSRPFDKTPFDALYDEYEADLQVADPKETPETIEIKEGELPNFGAALGAFDSEVREIPWDSDFRDILPKNILWGQVSPEASKSIFLKSYNRLLFGNVNNLLLNEQGKLQYYFPVLGVSTNDPDTMRNAALGEAGIQIGASFAKGPAVRLATTLMKDRRVVDFAAKSLMGARKAAQLLGRLTSKLTLFFTRKLIKLVSKFIMKSLVVRAIATASVAAATAATAASLGAAAPLLAAAISIATAVNTFLTVMDAFVGALVGIVGPILAQMFDPSGVCPDGTQSIESQIPPTIYALVTAILPLGDVLDLLGPYICVGSGGRVAMRKKVGSQPYYEDSTLSVYYHNWPKNEIPSGETTGFYPPEIPPGYVCNATDCYSPCPTGSYAASEFSALCTQDRYPLQGRISTVVFGETIQCKENEQLIDGICYERCKAGFTMATTSTGSKECLATVSGSLTRTTVPLTYEKRTRPGYDPPDLNSLTFNWCNFASPTMMDRMAQFYYNNSYRSAYPVDASGTVEFEYIYKFGGVIASSELSCDVACLTRKVRFNPITGENFSQLDSVEPDPETGDAYSYRRFYFIKGPADPKGVFTVTGCTNTQFTAPDAMKNSLEALEDGEEYVPSVPKIFEITNKTNSVRPSLQTIIGAAAGAVGGLLGAGGGALGGRTGAALGGIGMLGGLGGSAVSMMNPATTTALNGQIAAQSVSPTPYEGQDSFIVKGDEDKYMLVNDNEFFTIQRGLIKEQAVGYDPALQYCATAKTTAAICSYKYVVRDVINKYHVANPARRVRELLAIEPRGTNACWYRWKEVDFDVANNRETSEPRAKEIVEVYEIADNLTCVMKPVRLDENVGTYEVRKFAGALSSNTVASSDAPAAAAVSSAASDQPIAAPRVYRGDSGPSMNVSRQAQEGGAPDIVAPAMNIATMNGGELWIPDRAAPYILTNSDGSEFRTTVESVSDNRVMATYQYTVNKAVFKFKVAAIPYGDGYSQVNIGLSSTRVIPQNGAYSLTQDATKEVYGLTLYINYPRYNARDIKEYWYNVNTTIGQTQTITTKLFSTQTMAEGRFNLEDEFTIVLGAETVYIIKNGVIEVSVNRKNASSNLVPYIYTRFGAEKTENTLIRDISIRTADFTTVYAERKDLTQVALNDGVTAFPESEVPEVFAVGPCGAESTFTKAEAAAKCTALGGRQASFTDLLVAQALGADWCCPGWVSDREVPQFPITTRLNQCGGGTAGVKAQQGRVAKAAALCYGLKPPADSPEARTITPFNESAWALNRRTAPKAPRRPLKLPILIPPESTLGGTSCPERKCQDKAQIERLMADFNSAYSDRKILRVLRGWTTSPSRCDYEVELLRQTPEGKSTLSKETLRIDVAVDPASPCLFRRTGDGSAALNSGTFIIPTTPALEGEGVEGGVFVGTDLLTAIKTDVAKSMTPVLGLNLDSTLVDPTQKAKEAAEGVLDAVAKNQQFVGCPSKKCSDPDILAAIQQTYNLKNGYKGIYDTGRHVMKRVLRTVLNGNNTCDIQFEDLYEQNEDILYAPDESEVSVKTMRFKLGGGGATNCAGFRVEGEPTDLPEASKALASPLAETLNPPFTKGRCEFKCLDPALLGKLKETLDTKYSTVRPQMTQSFQTVIRSFRASLNVCEYKILKDRVGYDRMAGEEVDETGAETYVRAELELDPVKCSVELKSAMEFFPPELDVRVNPKTGEEELVRFGRKVTEIPPALLNYDEDRAPSKKVLRIVKNMGE